MIPVPHDLLCSHIFGPLRGANGSLKPGRPLEKLSKKLYHNNFECITQFNILGHQGDRLGLLSRPFECCSMAVKNKTFFFSVWKVLSCYCCLCHVRQTDMSKKAKIHLWILITTLLRHNKEVERKLRVKRTTCKLGDSYKSHSEQLNTECDGNAFGGLPVAPWEGKSRVDETSWALGKRTVRQMHEPLNAQQWHVSCLAAQKLYISAKSQFESTESYFHGTLFASAITVEVRKWFLSSNLDQQN